MGYRSDVKIVMANKAYELLKTEILKSDLSYAREMIESPHDFKQIEEDRIIIGWRYVKWNSSFQDVGAVIKVLRTLDEIVEKDPYCLEDYFYKLIKIGEDNKTEECSNDADEMYVDDFYVKIDFSL